MGKTLKRDRGVAGVCWGGGEKGGYRTQKGPGYASKVGKDTVWEMTARAMSRGIGSMVRKKNIKRKNLPKLTQASSPQGPGGVARKKKTKA